MWKEAQNLGALISERISIDLDEADVIGASLEGYLPEPCGIEDRRRGWSNAAASPLAVRFDGRMFCQQRHIASNLYIQPSGQKIQGRG
jgi:hypothetical protein